MKKPLLRMISLILVLTIVLQSTGMLRIVAYAQENEDEEITVTTADEVAEPEIVGEVLSKRDESVKHFSHVRRKLYCDFLRFSRSLSG